MTDELVSQIEAEDSFVLNQWSHRWHQFAPRLLPISQDAAPGHRRTALASEDCGVEDQLLDAPQGAHTVLGAEHSVVRIVSLAYIHPAAYVCALRRRNIVRGEKLQVASSTGLGDQAQQQKGMTVTTK